MKKNKMMRLASGLLVLALLTTGIIGGTLAKYTTLNSANDSARVAKWGVMVEVAGNLFGAQYDKKDSTTNSDKIAVSTSSEINVKNTSLPADGKNIVAPGTKNDTGLTVKIGGTSEVAYKITVDNNGQEAEDIFLAAGDWGVMVEVTELNDASDVTGYYTESSKTYTKVAAGSVYEDTKKYYELIDTATVATGGYYPINWTVAETGNAAAVTDVKNLAAISTAMIDGIKKGKDANVSDGTRDVGIDSAASYTLTWKWPFEGGNDGADTILGNLMAGNLANGTVVKANADEYTSDLKAGTDYNLEVAFGMKVTATQLD